MKYISEYQPVNKLTIMIFIRKKYNWLREKSSKTDLKNELYKF